MVCFLSILCSTSLKCLWSKQLVKREISLKLHNKEQLFFDLQKARKKKNFGVTLKQLFVMKRPFAALFLQFLPIMLVTIYLQKMPFLWWLPSQFRTHAKGVGKFLFPTNLALVYNQRENVFKVWMLFNKN